MVASPTAVQPGFMKPERLGRYEYAPALLGRKLRNPTGGKPTMRGSKITWRSDTYRGAGWYGVWNEPSRLHNYGFVASSAT
jgi:hypothetical protein